MTKLRVNNPPAINRKSYITPGLGNATSFYVSFYPCCANKSIGIPAAAAPRALAEDSREKH